MNDISPDARFSFGKVEFGVVPDSAPILSSPTPSCSDAVHAALCHKMDAVDALDALRHTLTSNMSKAQYIIIRNSLEELSDLLRRYEGKPAPKAPKDICHKNEHYNTKKRKNHKGGNKHD